jgi:hypothetical protein
MFRQVKAGCEAKKIKKTPTFPDELLNLYSHSGLE